MNSIIKIKEVILFIHWEKKYCINLFFFHSKLNECETSLKKKILFPFEHSLIFERNNWKNESTIKFTFFPLPLIND